MSIIRNIIWDFDGVIIDSVAIKTAGFEFIFRDYPPVAVAQLAEFHLANGGISRFEKIAYFFKHIVKSPQSDDIVQHYAHQFSQFCLESLRQPRYLIKPTVDFIKQYHDTYPMHIASGAWEQELLLLCRIHQIDPYFISIHGSPRKKTDLVRDIIKKYGYKTQETCLIGDSIQDYQSAKENGILYFGYNNEKMRPLSDQYFEDFSSLEKDIIS